MKNARRAGAALVLSISLAVPAAAAADGPAAPPPRPTDPRTSAVVQANAAVDEAIEELRVGAGDATVEVVRVGDAARRLVRDRRFLENVHALQDFLNNHDAGGLAGADVAIVDLLAVDVRRDGHLVVFAR